MTTTIDALHIFSLSDSNRPTALLSHTWAGRPPSSNVLLPLYLDHPTPRPSLIYASSTNPPSLIHTIIQDRLLFLAPTSTDSDPFLVITFLHRVADALEDFLGSPLLPTKISSSYDVLIQILTETCDAGIINTTEPNALHELVESPSWMNRLLGSSSSTSSSGPSPSVLTGISSTTSAQNQAPAIPWRKSNVKHTSNELYVDIVESLHVITAPSGIPLLAKADGTIVFTAKVSGTPELLLILGSQSGGSVGVARTVQLPTFHPCVRLNRWRDRPGELSFVPPDGKFILCSYSVDLLGADYYDNIQTASSKNKLVIPATVTISPSISASITHTAFTVSLNVHHAFCTPAPQNAGIMAAAAASRTQGTSSHPTLEEVTVKIPVSSAVRGLPLLKASRGDARWAPGQEHIVWKLRTKDIQAMGSNLRISNTGGVATLRVEMLGEDLASEQDDDVDDLNMSSKYDYDDGDAVAEKKQKKSTTKSNGAANLMPSGASVGFTLRGWLASGLKVEKLALDAQRSRGLGAGVTPYKGVKYITVSQDGVETRA